MPLLLHGAQRADAGRRRGGRGRDGTVRRPDGGRRLRLHRARGRRDQAPRWCWWSTSRRSSRTVGAWVHGLHTFDPDTRIAGVIVNKAGSARHSDEVVAALRRPAPGARASCRGTPGSRRPRGTWGWCRRPSEPRRRPRLDRLAEQIAEHVDLTRVLAIAHTAPTAGRTPWDAGRPSDTGAVDGPRSPTRRHRPAGGRGGRRARLHLPLRRDDRAADGGRSATGGLRPGHRHRPARPARRGSTSAAASPRCTPPSWPATRPCSRRCAARSRPACRRWPSAPGCSTCAARSTACRWWARSTPTRPCRRS